MRAFVFDTETTGLVKNSLVPLPNQPRVIEFYSHTVDSQTGEQISEIEFFCDPGIELDAIITRITGIKPEDVKGLPGFRVHLDKILEEVSCADMVVAHNLSFDMALLDAEAARCGKKVVWPAMKICTVEQTEWLKGHRLSLSALHELLFGEPFSGAHRARVDVEALTRCFIELRKRGDL